MQNACKLFYVFDFTSFDSVLNDGNSMKTWNDFWNKQNENNVSVFV